MDLEEVVRNAWKVGNTINLSGVGYGKIHWGNEIDIIADPFDYYKFLSGFVASLELNRILEIGTHWGGATVAIARGCVFNNQNARPEIFTIDVTEESDQWLPLQPESAWILKHVGEASRRSAIRAALDFFQPDCRVDLLFIDSDHSFMPSLIQYATYSTVFLPKFVILDDISLNEEMCALWTLLKRVVPQNCFIVANEVVPQIRDRDAGFGIIANLDRVRNS